MRVHSVLLVLFPGLIAAALLAAIPLRTASAQICFDPQNPNKQIPCPGQEKEKRTKTPIVYPSFTPTPTSTATTTPTATPSPTSTPAPALWTSASGPANGPGGFNCPPYASSVPLGAGILGVGLLILASRARILGTRFPPGALQPASETDDSRGAEQDGAGLLWGVMMAVQKLLGREARADRKTSGADRQLEMREREEHLRQDNASIEAGMAEAGEKAAHSMAAASIGMLTGIIGGLLQIVGAGRTASNQGSGPINSRVVGAAVTGMGTGILGAGLWGGLLGFDCISTNVVLPGGALLGTILAIAAGLIYRTGGGIPEFDPIGQVNPDGSTTGGAGLYKGKDLE